MSENDGLAFACSFYDFGIENVIHDDLFFYAFLLSDADELLLKWDWPVSAVEVEESLVDVYPAEHGYVFVIRQSGTQSNNPNVLLTLLLLPKCPCHYTFQHRSSHVIQQMNFIYNE